MRLYYGSMKALTVSEAKKNLSSWFRGAFRREEIGIICTSDTIALRKVEVQAVDYGRSKDVSLRILRDRSTIADSSGTGGSDCKTSTILVPATVVPSLPFTSSIWPT